MAHRRDFKPGDRVENSYRARGKVTAAEPVLTVSYFDRGKSWTSRHTDPWFKRYPDMLKKVSER
jgi:hypothetical protein